MARCGIGKIILRSRRVWSRRCRAVAFGHPPVVHQRFQEVGQLAFFDPLMNILRSLRTQNCQSTRADGGKVYGCPSTSRSQGAPKFVFFGGSDLPLSLSMSPLQATDFICCFERKERTPKAISWKRVHRSSPGSPWFQLNCPPIQELWVFRTQGLLC